MSLNKIDLLDLKKSLARKHMGALPEIAHVLFFVEKCLLDLGKREVFCRAEVFRRGIVFCTVPSSAAAEKLVAAFDQILPLLCAQFPQLSFRGVRTRVLPETTR